MNDKRWRDHSEFLGALADHIIDVMVTDGISLGKYTEWLAEACFKHAEKHCWEDFENGVLEPGKVCEESQWNDFSENKMSSSRWNDVSENQMSGEISTSRDRVKREEPGDKKRWDDAKRGPHVYENADSVSNESIDDDSVIKTQEVCAKRFAEGQAVRRNYAGIND